MVKKTFLKECFRSIRGSFSRFLAIFLIVALGAGFLAGLLATTPDMRHTVSELYRETNLFDLRIVGNLGLEEVDHRFLGKNILRFCILFRVFRKHIVIFPLV